MEILQLNTFSRDEADYQLNVPSIWPALGQGAAILLVGVGFAALAAQALGTAGGSAIRLAWAALCFLGGLFAVVTAANRFRHATSILSYWTGSGPLRESTGSCRLQQRTDGIWGMQLSFGETTAAELAAPAHSAVTDPTLFFRLDEAEVAELTRVLDPEQTVNVRWMDLPDAVGGPLLLRMEKTELAAEEDAEIELLAA